MNDPKEMNATELADLLEEKAKKLRETGNLSAVTGGDEGEEGGCNSCCGKNCFSDSLACADSPSSQGCRMACVAKSSN